MLIFSDDEEEAATLATLLERHGCSSRILNFKDSVRAHLTPSTKMVFLVMREIGELGFGLAIKISGVRGSAPLVMAGPAWTRATVIKAVKYGAADILLTPASEEDVREKLKSNMVQ
ncbi:MAG: hypothetical protein CSA34_01145 [Desulfobulbus propionicus]|nr:MAG: hypothetical protein CSA34_01145 [Desulfobulbus propionicus]